MRGGGGPGRRSPRARPGQSLGRREIIQCSEDKRILGSELATPHSGGLSVVVCSSVVVSTSVVVSSVVVVVVVVVVEVVVVLVVVLVVVVVEVVVVVVVVGLRQDMN